MVRIMQVITCPNCGKLLEYRKGASEYNSFTVLCPKCGEVPLLEDSQVITISDGQFDGPGLRNLQEQGEELRIHEGKIIKNGDLQARYEDEESVIKVESPSQASSTGPAFQSKVPSATVEEKLDFEWKAESKEVGHRAISHKISPVHVQPVQTSPSSLPVKPAPKSSGTLAPKISEINEKEERHSSRMPKPKEKQPAAHPVSKRTGTGTGKKKYPWYYYGLFYGVPVMIIVLLCMLVLYRLVLYKFFSPQTQEVVIVGPHEIWKNAELSYGEAHVYYQEALNDREKGRKKSYQEKLKRADTLCKKSLELGQKSWEEQIKLLMEQKSLSKEEAEKYAQTYYGGYPEKMQLWQQEHRLILEELTRVDQNKNK